MTRHRFDPISFLFGLLFLGIGVTGLITGSGLSVDGRWVWPALFLVGGLVVLAATMSRERRSRNRITEDAASAEPDAEAEPLPFED